MQAGVGKVALEVAFPNPTGRCGGLDWRVPKLHERWLLEDGLELCPRVESVPCQPRRLVGLRPTIDRMKSITTWTSQDIRYIERTVELALGAEGRGDVPVGSVITLMDEVVSEGSARVMSEGYQPRRHAEQEALAGVPIELWPRAKEMTCYSSLEPCLMCYGSLLLCGIGRVVFGATDLLGGARFIFDTMPPYYADGRGMPTWVGPVLPEICDALYERVDARFRTLPCG